MDREYDIFEQYPDGFPVWRGHASGLQNASLKLQQIAKTTSDECFLMFVPTKEILARLNIAPMRDDGRKPLVFQIAYDKELAVQRTKVLRLYGFDVATVVGNESAKALLNIALQCDFFMVGHNAPKPAREEIVRWLRTRYPGVRVLALNPPETPALAGADFNVKVNGPETWLPFLAPPSHRNPSTL